MRKVRGGGKGMKRRGEAITIDWLPHVHVLMGNQNHNLDICPDREWNQQIYGLWDYTPTT